MQKTLMFLYLCLLVLFLTIISMAYFYEQNEWFRNFSGKNMIFIIPFLRALIAKYAQFYEIDMQYIILILWGIVFISSLMGFLEKPEKPLFYYPFTAFFTVIFCIISTIITLLIYYWSSDTIEIFGLISFYRGSQEKYLNDLLYLMNVLTIIYLYFFIINRIHLWIKTEKKVLSERLRSNKKGSK